MSRPFLLPTATIVLLGACVPREANPQVDTLPRRNAESSRAGKDSSPILGPRGDTTGWVVRWDAAHARGGDARIPAGAGRDSGARRSSDRTLHPNEPEGMEVLCDHTANKLPPHEGSGHWDNPEANPKEVKAGWWRYLYNARLGEDPGSPVSPPGYWFGVYRKGRYGGQGPVKVWCRQNPVGRQREFKRLYLSVWYRVGDPGTRTYEGHDDFTKAFFIPVGSPQPSDRGNVILGIAGDGGGRPSIKSTWRPSYDIEGRGILPHQRSISRLRAIKAGVWQHWEVLLELGGPGSPGRIHWWIDGETVLDQRNAIMQVRREGYTHGFRDINWPATYGGGPRQRSRPDPVAVAHIYLSAGDECGAECYGDSGPPAGRE